MKNILLCALLLAVSVTTFARQGTPRQGKVQIIDETPFAWHQGSQQWLPIEEFWMLYADETGGLKWGQREDYPPYDEVSELDKMIIRGEKGNCLMEFFHERWRRANDVRRWDPKFNEYGGCPFVFD